MKKLKLALSGILAVPTFAMLPMGSQTQAQAQEMQTAPFFETLKPYLIFRPRYEFVDDNIHDNANALTVRTVIGSKLISIGGVKGLNAQIEATNVSALIDNYNSTSAAGNNDTRYAIVIDPPTTRITQANISYTTGKTTFIVGRKMVTLDNHRFIGNVGWRQMPQTFGVIAVINNSIKNFNLLAALVYERLGIKDELNKSWKLADAPILLHGAYSVSKALKITVYDYMLTDIHDTYGVRLTGLKKASKSTKFSYVLEYAWQDDPTKRDNWNSSTNNIDSYYYDIGLNVYSSGLIFGANYEVLGEARGNATQGFSTPLATAHKFQGWSDVLIGKELNGDTNGLKDLLLTIGYATKKTGKLLLRFHKYDSKVNSLDYGKEFEFLYVKKITKRLGLLVKGALYKAGDDYGYGYPSNREDVTKTWFQLTYKY